MTDGADIMKAVYTYSFMETSTPTPPVNFQRRFYYLLNFEMALEWLAARYDDL